MSLPSLSCAHPCLSFRGLTPSSCLVRMCPLPAYSLKVLYLVLRRQWTMTASSRTVQSYVERGAECPGCLRQCSSSDFVFVKWSLPLKFESDGGKDCISCAKNSDKSPPRFCIEMYSWPKSVTLVWSTLVFFPCFDVAVRWEFVKSTREFFLIGSCAHQAHSCHSDGTVSCLYRLRCTLWLPLIRLHRCNCQELLAPGSHPRTDCPFVWWFQRG